MVLAGAGDDVVNWDPGDGSDSVDGQAGSDRLVFNGATIGEIFEVSAAGDHVVFTRNIATVALDLDGVERIDVGARGGTDSLIVNDVTGTDLAIIVADIGAVGGGGDLAADTVVVNGTAADDVFDVVAVAGSVEASRTGGATVRIYRLGAGAGLARRQWPGGRGCDYGRGGHRGPDPGGREPLDRRFDALYLWRRGQLGPAATFVRVSFIHIRHRDRTGGGRKYRPS